jgi:hypothetical protein
MDEPEPARCLLCRSPLQAVHGHFVCLNPECPLHAVAQDSCCGGAPTEPAEEPDSVGVRWRPDEG